METWKMIEIGETMTSPHNAVPLKTTNIPLN